LHAAAEEGNIDVVKSLLERVAGNNGRNESDRTSFILDMTPLHKASQYGHPEVAQVLIDHGANLNARDQNHWTPIHYSAEHVHVGLVKLLLERGADVHAMNDEGGTPYHVSLQRGNREIADYLQRYGTGRERFDDILL
jgi:ankyrin repeat protein